MMLQKVAVLVCPCRPQFSFPSGLYSSHEAAPTEVGRVLVVHLLSWLSIKHPAHQSSITAMTPVCEQHVFTHTTRSLTRTQI